MISRNNAAWLPLDNVTVIDVLESGACIDGVLGVVGRTLTISGPPTDTQMTETWLAKAARLDGSGDGDGYGYGDGYGSGYGYGSGDGEMNLAEIT